MSDFDVNGSIDLDNPEFQNVMRLVNFTNRSVFMTGKAGTGKSTFLRYITSNTRKKHIVLAPTGIAAVNAGGVTLHSFFRIPLKPLLPDDPELSIRRLRQRLKYPSSLVKLLRNLELIVIDEISMVRADLLDFIDKILRVYCGNMRQPFAGKQLLLVGDIFQLEPVVTNESRQILSKYYSSFYFFSARVFKETTIIPIELSKIYRQNETFFISILDRIRLGKATPDDLNSLNLRVLPQGKRDEIMNQEEFTMTLATQRNMVDSINDYHLEKIKMPEITYKGIVTGDFPESSMPAPMELKVKNGAQIVFIRNDINHQWVNGTLGIVVSSNEQSLEIQLENGNTVFVEPERWSNIRYDYNETEKTITEIELGTYTQMPVRLAWALTIHKSQGLTFKKVIIDLGQGAFAGGQTYVALSRCRTLDGLLLRNPIRPSDIFVKRDIVEFSNTFNNRSLIDRAIEEARIDASFSEAAKLWNSGKRMEGLSLFLESNGSKNMTKSPVVRRLITQKAFSLIKSMDDKDNQIRDLNNRLTELNIKLRHIALEFVFLGDDCYEGGDLSGALEQYSQALKISSFLPEATRGKAKVLIDTGDETEAFNTLTPLINSPFAESEDFVKYSALLFSFGEITEGLDTLLRGHQLFPADIQIITELISVYTDIGDMSEVKQLKAQLRKIKQKKR